MARRGARLREGAGGAQWQVCVDGGPWAGGCAGRVRVPGRVPGALWLSARGSAGGGAALTRVSFLAVSECDTGVPHGSAAASDTPMVVGSYRRWCAVL